MKSEMGENMKILLICSKNFYDKIPPIKELLEEKGIEVYLPNCYDSPQTEDVMRQKGEAAHQSFKAEMFRRSEKIISDMDAVMALNFDKLKDGMIYKNYIGGATFLEMYDAFRMNKTIYMLNPIPEGILYDEIKGFSPVIIDGDLTRM